MLGLLFYLRAFKPSRWKQAQSGLVRLARLLALGASLICAPAHALEDAVLERAFWRDDSGQVGFEQARTQSFTPYSGLLTQGYQRQASYWFRVKVQGADPDTPAYVMRLRPFWHDEFELVDPADIRTEPRLGGDRYPWSDKEFPALNHTFLLKKTENDRYVYLRLNSVHTYLLHIQVVEQDDARRIEWKSQVAYIIYMAVLGVVLVWAAASLVARPEKVMAAFVAYLTVLMAYCFSLLGLAHVLLDGLVPSAWLNTATSVSVVLCTATGLNFHRALLREYPLRRGFGALLDLLTALPLAMLLVMAAGEATWALMLNAYVLLAFSFASFLIAWSGIRKHPPDESIRLPRWSVKMFYAMLLMVSIAGALPLVGWLKGTESTLHAFLGHGALVTLVMGQLLYVRGRRRMEQQIEQLATARQKAEQERHARVQQNQFMSMLNHELKTPMSVLKLLVSGQPIQARADTQIDTMLGLLERCLLSDRIESQASGIRRTRFSPAQVLSDCMAGSRAPDRFVLEAVTPDLLVADPDLYAVAVNNLLDNALLYAAPLTPVTLALRCDRIDDRDMICLTVSNAIGRAGVPDLAHVFDKYYRAESARSTPGTGLGLYLVKSFTELLGGRVDCILETTRIRFQLCLPR